MSYDQTEKSRIEILLDAPLLEWLLGKFKAAGVVGHTVYPILSGEGEAGHWHEDQITSAQQKVMVLVIADHAKAEELLEVLRPVLDSYGIVVMASTVTVLRAKKFT